jgi:tryptophan synthase alpha chain
MESSQRIAAAFAAAKAESRPALVAYLTAGAPTPAHTAGLALALERGGADILELGVPFSDPVADGPVIMRASDRAIHAGTTVRGVLQIAAQIRAKSSMPIILFSYLNPLMRYGLQDLARDARAAGIDGVLLTDLSVEEAAEPVAQLRAAGLDPVFLASPTSTERRLKLVADLSSGFVYVISRTGVTGEQSSVAESVQPLVEKIRSLTSSPLAVGFGVSKPEHVRAIGAYADGVIIGSAIMRAVEENAATPDLESRLEAFMRSLSGREVSRP